jgi:hypothetical protein
MKENKKPECCKEKVINKNYRNYNRGSSGAIYGLGMIGALFYFLQNATNFGMVMLGIGKAIFWPAILMFKLLTYLHM